MASPVAVVFTYIRSDKFRQTSGKPVVLHAVMVVRDQGISGITIDVNAFREVVEERPMCFITGLTLSLFNSLCLRSISGTKQSIFRKVISCSGFWRFAIRNRSQVFPLFGYEHRKVSVGRMRSSPRRWRRVSYSWSGRTNLFMGDLSALGTRSRIRVPAGSSTIAPRPAEPERE